MPKIIHFIWVGPKPCPKLELINRWRSANPDCQVILWTDRKATPSSVFEGYGKLGCGFVGNLEALTHLHPPSTSSDESDKPLLIADLGTLFHDAQSFLDPEFVALVERTIRYEIERPHPNFGCASDLLRYLILHTYGGAYFDCDVQPRNNKISSVCESFQKNTEEFKITKFSQGMRAIGNDALVCSAGHPFIKEALLAAMENYTKLIYNDPTDYDEPEYVFHNTITKTGPSLIRSALSTIEAYLKLGRDTTLSIAIYNPHSPNDASWAQRFMYATSSLNEALDNAQKHLSFECECIGILRFRDYTRDIINSLQKPLLQALSSCIKDSIMTHVPLEPMSHKEALLAACEAMGISKDFIEPLISKIIPTIEPEKIPIKTLVSNLVTAISQQEPFNSEPYKLMKYFLDLDQPLKSLSILCQPLERLLTEFNALGCPLSTSVNVQELTLKDCYQACKLLTSSVGEISLIEKTVGNHLALRLLDKIHLIEHVVAKKNFSKLDIEFAPCIDFLINCKANPELGKIKEVMRSINQCLINSDELFAKKSMHFRAPKARNELKVSAYQTQKLIIETLDEWAKSDKTPTDELELTCKLHEIQALALETEITYQKARLTLGVLDSGFSNTLLELRERAEEHRLAIDEIKKPKEPSLDHK